MSSPSKRYDQRFGERPIGQTPMKVCEFKTGENNELARYHPGMITGFGYLEDAGTSRALIFLQ